MDSHFLPLDFSAIRRKLDEEREARRRDVIYAEQKCAERRELYSDRERYIDIFLSHFGFDTRGEERYKRVKNAISIASEGKGIEITKIYAMLAEKENMPFYELAEDIRKTVNSAPRPAYVSFNAAFAPPKYSFGTPMHIQMPAYDDPDKIIAYLGITLFYLFAANI